VSSVIKNLTGVISGVVVWTVVQQGVVTMKRGFTQKKTRINAEILAS